MAITDIENGMEGITTNPGLILRAANYNPGAESVYDITYLGGGGVRGKIPGEKLMETSWQGVLAGNVLPTLFFSDGGGSPALSDGLDGLKMMVYKRSKNDKSETISTKVMDFYYKGGVSNNNGSIAYDVSNMVMAVKYYYFDPTYEYKFVVMVGRLTPGAYIDLEGIKFQFQQQIGMTGTTQYVANDAAGSASLYEGEREMIPTLTSWIWSGTSDAGTGSVNTGRLVAQLPLAVYDGDGTYSAYGRSITLGSGVTGWRSTMPGFPASIQFVDSVLTSVYGGPATSSIVIVSSANWNAEAGCYHPAINGGGFPNSTQFWFSTTMHGAYYPEAI